MGLRRRPEDRSGFSPAVTSTSTTSPGLTTDLAGGGAGQDDVAGFQGDQPGQVGNDVAEAEQRVPRRPGVLGQAPVDPGAQPDSGQVDVARVDQPRAERGEAVDPFGPHVGAPVGVPEVVDAEVVRGGDPGHVVPAVSPADPAGPAPDDQRHLALEGEQFAAGRAGNRVAAFGQRGGRLEEIGRPGRRRATFGRTAAVTDVHRDDLAGNAFQGCHSAKIIYDRSGAGICHRNPVHPVPAFGDIDDTTARQAH